MRFLNKNSCYLYSNVSQISIELPPPTHTHTHSYLRKLRPREVETVTVNSCWVGVGNQVSYELIYLSSFIFHPWGTLLVEISSEELWKHADVLFRSFNTKCIVQLQGICLVENLPLLSAFKIQLNFWAEATLSLCSFQPKTQHSGNTRTWSFSPSGLGRTWFLPSFHCWVSMYASKCGEEQRAWVWTMLNW